MAPPRLSRSRSEDEGWAVVLYNLLHRAKLLSRDFLHKNVSCGGDKCSRKRGLAIRLTSRMNFCNYVEHLADTVDSLSRNPRLAKYFLGLLRETVESDGWHQIDRVFGSVPVVVF